MPHATEDTLETIAQWLRASSFTIALTGAGISTDSGIPDFRGPQGVWTKNPEAEKKATIQHFLSSSDARKESWRNRLSNPMGAAAPNPGHAALAELEHKGRLHALVTQNVDGLHLDAGTTRDNLIEIHGTVREFQCLHCPDRGPIERVLERVKSGDEDPACRSCGGILKSATISFGQNLVPSDLERAEAAASMADVFLAIGTTLTVYPVALLPDMALRNGAKLVIINAQETPYDPHADAILNDPISDVLPRITDLV